MCGLNEGSGQQRERTLPVSASPSLSPPARWPGPAGPSGAWVGRGSLLWEHLHQLASFSEGGGRGPQEGREGPAWLSGIT